MQISHILNTPLSNNNIISSNFKGLWGKTTRIVDKDPVLCVPTDYETYYYYPFSDETQEEIDKIVEQNTDAKYDKTSGKGKYVVKECKVCIRLPFKKANYENYAAATAGTRMSSKLKVINYYAADKYKNNTKMQESAVNEVIAKRLNTKA